MAEEAALTVILQEIFEKLEPTPMAYTDPLTTPFSDCFHWNTLFSGHPVPSEVTLYAVSFRSVRKEEDHALAIDDAALDAADARAFQEARDTGALLRYWSGNVNSRRECLSTCIWRSREAAVGSAAAPLHSKAAALAPHFYQSYTLERLWLHCNPDGSFAIDPMPSTHTEYE